MPRTFICLHCSKIRPLNPRVKKKQKYCSEKECQQSRMRSWKRKQYKNNDSYRKMCLESQKAWRKHYPSDLYQKDYRKSHPGYAKRNREQQTSRNKKRQKESLPMIVKMQSLLLQPREDGSYTLSKVKKKLIVNRNTLTIQPSIDGVYTLFNINERKIVNRNALMSPSLSP